MIFKLPFIFSFQIIFKFFKPCFKIFFLFLVPRKKFWKQEHLNSNEMHANYIKRSWSKMKVFRQPRTSSIQIYQLDYKPNWKTVLHHRVWTNPVKISESSILSSSHRNEIFKCFKLRISCGFLHPHYSISPLCFLWSLKTIKAINI